MASRTRVVAYGSAALVFLAGVACAVLVDGLTGEVLTIVLMSVGLAGALLFVFLDIGLGEERDLARERERSGRRPRRAFDARRRLRAHRRRPD
jgi:hypothetical protein